MNPLNYPEESFPDNNTSLERRIIVIPGVEIRRLKNAGNYKGPIHQWTLPLDKPVVQLNAFDRAKGTLFGDHFHKGADPSKAPEFFWVIHGSFEFWAYNKFTKHENKATLTAGDTITIRPHILHRFEALTDVKYVEPRVTIYGEIKDQYGPDIYETHTL